MNKITAFLTCCLMATSVYANPFNEINWHSATVAEVENAIASGGDVNTANDMGVSPLVLAIMGRPHDIELIQLLLDKGANINENGKRGTPLMWAVYNTDANLDMIKLLLDRGADINLSDERGDTALTRAVSVSKPNLDVIKFLLDNGADIHVKDKEGYTILMRSFFVNGSPSLEVMNLLLDKGVDINAKNMYGRTALMLAVDESESNLDVVNLLLDRGADVNIKNVGNKTALDLAKENPKIVGTEMYQKMKNMASPEVVTELDKVLSPISPVAETFYHDLMNEGIPEIVKKSLYGVVDNSADIETAVQEILKSINVEKLKQDTWGCLSQLPEEEWISKEGGHCFDDLKVEIMLLTMPYLAPKEVFAKNYANGVIDEAAKMAILAFTKTAVEEDGLPDEMSPAFLYGEEMKMPCNAEFYATKESIVGVRFNAICSRGNQGKVDVPSDDVIQEMLKIDSDKIRCSGRFCVINFNYN